MSRIGAALLAVLAVFTLSSCGPPEGSYQVEEDVKCKSGYSYREYRTGRSWTFWCIPQERR